MNTSDPEIIEVPPENIVDHDAVPQNPPVMKTRSSRQTQLAVGALLLGLVAGGWIYRDVLSGFFPSSQMTALQSRMDAADVTNKDLAKRIDAVIGVTEELKSKVSAAQSAADEAAKQLNPLQAQSSAATKSITVVQKSLDDLKIAMGKIQPQQPSSPAPSAPVDEQRLVKLEKDVEALKQARDAAASAGQKLSAALSSLTTRIAQGQPFSEDYATLKQLSPTTEGLDVLGREAQTGVATAQDLTTQLASISASLPNAQAPAAPTDSSYWGQFLGLLSNIMTINDAGPADWKTIVAKAQAFAEAGDLAQAVATVEQAPPPLPEALLKWHDQATRRLALDGAVQKLSAALATKIQGPAP